MLDISCNYLYEYFWIIINCIQFKNNSFCVQITNVPGDQMFVVDLLKVNCWDLIYTMLLNGFK